MKRARLSPARNCRPAAGFTLVEIMIVLAIAGVLVSALVPLTELAGQRSKERELRSALREIRTALDNYKRIHDEGRLGKQIGASGYPPSLDVLVAGVDDTSSQEKRRIYLLRRLPRDPFADSATPAAATWGLRSYESPPDSPSPGRDVFDVHSLASGAGLNGVPYRDW